MDQSRIELAEGVWADSRRALYLRREGTLCIADPHVGYSWAHRHAGQMLPLGPQDDAAERLVDLCATYKPTLTVVLGDIVHRAVPKSEVQNELSRFLERVSSCARLELILGNHDRGLGKVLPPHITARQELQVGNYTLLHGDSAPGAGAGRLIIGHEHPALRLGDGVKGAKFPCFLHGPRVTVLPAFSSWAAGTDIRQGYLSPLARAAEFTHAVAIMGDRLLRVPLAALRPRA